MTGWSPESPAGETRALADGNASSAITLLENAAHTWRELETPYAAASVAVLVAQACRALGDDEAARAELAYARGIFTRLGAWPDVGRVEAMQSMPGQAAQRAGATVRTLTTRELEVLSLVAAGASNHEIARRLFLSDRTVHRHVSHIFDKLRVRTRTAAAAIAIRDRLTG